MSLKKDINSQQTALRVVAATEPGYFRAKAYDVYENRKWLLNTEGRAISPEPTTPDGSREDAHIGQAFRITASNTPGAKQFEVWPDTNLGDAFAAPIGTHWLYADAQIVTVDTHRIIRSSDAAIGVPYTLIAGDADQLTPDGNTTSNQPGSSQSRQRSVDLQQLATPPGWAGSNAELMSLSDSVFKDCNSVREKVQAVHRYFDQNYSYSLTVTPQISPQEEPLEWFLLKQPAAHCEYFASGTAVLLRMAGVPCRYVVGFVISEKNQYSGEWVARNEDAHAWVEAYDETRGWVTVDTTPAAGIPDDIAVSSWTQLYEYLRGEFHRLRTGWQQHGVASLADSLKAFVASPTGSTLIASLALTFLGIVLWRRQLQIHPDHKGYVDVSPVVVQLQTARTKLDKAITRVWRERRPDETVSVYAQQLAVDTPDPRDSLAQAAVWYNQYAALRFAASPDRSIVEELVALADQLGTDLRKRNRRPDTDLSAQSST